MQKKKNGFLLFIFSFMPGAGEMYMGFMKMGLSLMTAFFIPVVLAEFTNIQEIMFLSAIVYIYSFFHAHNIAGLDDERFMALEDDYIIGKDVLEKACKALKGAHKKYIAIFLIVVGFIMMWKSAIEVIYARLGHDNVIVKLLFSITDYAPRFILGVVIIVAGIFLIKGKKSDNIDEKEDEGK